MTDPIGGLAMLLQTIEDGKGLRFFKNEDDEICVSLVRQEDLVELAKDQTKIHIICMMMRVGVDFFFNHLEYTYFPPLTPENDEYDYCVFKWNNLMWSICSIPLEKKPLAEESAKEAKMKLADGIPFMAGPVVAATRPERLEDLEVDWFPLNGETVFTLENTKDSDVSVYDGKGAEQDLQAEYDYKLTKLYESKNVSRGW
jgi:hypothetical protein